ncbi:MAG: hypothetical protein BGO21_07980 [Dyadobacter sp. 50-39]|uniref:hypothetical protein n=1 Tax=Dyadobacter sp. 50-39 TaxID=1895756 RepID=UPI00096380E0|nr:hypothetical protein [Dyadobacter sp. 50-39]OJV20508.1 MAG: hypothetical protein BGO21_07980 [Dyadobacter sp. 50-39]
MKQKLRLIAAITAMTCGGLLLGSTCYAQVKIGTNPTSIDGNANLEVEASTIGRKVSVHKTTGKVTIKDGTEGAAKVLTSDAGGNAEWKDIPIRDQKVEYAFRARNDVAVDVQTGSNTYVYEGYDLKTETAGNRFNTGDRFNFTSGVFTALKKGYYLFNAGIRVDIKNGTTPGSHQVTASVKRRSADGTFSDYRGIVNETELVNGKYSYNVSTLYLLEANDQVYIDITRAVPGRDYKIVSGFLEGVAIGLFE